MTLMSRFGMLLLIVSAGCAPIALGQTSNSDTEIEARITPSSVYVPLHQPVEASLTIQNGDLGSVSFNLGDDREMGMKMHVILPDGTDRTGRISPHEGLARVGLVSLERNKAYSQKLVLNRWVSFDQEGTYRVTVVFDNAATLADSRKKQLDNVTIVVNVGEPSDEALKNFCAVNLKRLLEAQGYVEARDSAQVLRYVSDPIAVPYLQRGLVSPFPIQSLLVDGLARIGTSQAVSVLLDQLKRTPAKESSYLRSVLAAAQEKSTDPDVRMRIQEALQVRP